MCVASLAHAHNTRHKVMSALNMPCRGNNNKKYDLAAIEDTAEDINASKYRVNELQP